MVEIIILGLVLLIFIVFILGKNYDKYRSIVDTALIESGYKKNDSDNLPTYYKVLPDGTPIEVIPRITPVKISHRVNKMFVHLMVHIPIEHPYHFIVLNYQHRNIIFDDHPESQDYKKYLDLDKDISIWGTEEAEVTTIFDDFDKRLQLEEFNDTFQYVILKRDRFDLSTCIFCNEVVIKEMLKFIETLVDDIIARDITKIIEDIEVYTCQVCQTEISIQQTRCPSCKSALPRCTICFSYFDDDPIAAQLSCCKVFVHQDEFQDWYAINPICPYCGKSSPKVSSIIDPVNQLA